jgi:hypothetical protein
MTNFILGFLTAVLLYRLIGSITKFMIIDKKKKVYKEILSNLDSDLVSFVYRINSMVSLKTKTSLGEISIIFYLDKKDIYLFEGDKAVYTSIDLPTKMIDDISTKIFSKFSFKINDVVIFNKSVYDKNTFYSMSNTGDSNPVSDKLEDSKPNYDLNDILDKINEVGYEKLSKSEKDFLNGLK